MAEQMTPGTSAKPGDENKGDAQAPDPKAQERKEAETSSTADLGPVEKAQNQMVAGATLDHGEESEAQKKLRESQEEDVKNYGQLPAQMHQDNQVDPPEGRRTLVDGLNPHLTEDQPVTGGTLPPV